MSLHAHLAIAYLCLETPREGLASHIHSKEIVDGLRKLNVRTEYFGFDQGDVSFWSKISASISLQFRLARKIRQYHAVYIRSHPFAFPIALLCRLVSVPTINEVNGTTEDIYLAHPCARPARLFIDALVRAQYRWSTGLIAVTPGLADLLRRRLGERAPRISVITNGANTDIFHPGRRSELPLPARYVVFVGTKVPWHDTDTLLKAMEQPDWPEDVSVVIVGSAGETTSVRAVATRSTRLVVAGCVSYEEVGGVLAQAMAAVIPISDPKQRSSAIGVAPLKLFEALGSGTPVIVSDLPYQAELVREMGAGLVFPMGDAGALARAVAYIDANLERFGAKGRSVAKIVHDQHSWKKRALETKVFLQDVLSSVLAVSIV